MEQTLIKDEIIRKNRSIARYETYPTPLTCAHLSNSLLINLEYHWSWSAIMRVVEKINERDCVTIHCDSCEITPKNEGEFEKILVKLENMPLVSSVHEAVFQYSELMLSRNNTEKVFS